MALIYRIEDGEGNGPYCGSFSFCFEEFDKDAHPMPQDDPSFCLGSKHYNYLRNFHFGFESLDSLKAWFYKSEWLKELDNNDYMISVYESNDYVLGRKQAIFIKEEAFLKRLIACIDV